MNFELKNKQITFQDKSKHTITHSSFGAKRPPSLRSAALPVNQLSGRPEKEYFRRSRGGSASAVSAASLTATEPPQTALQTMLGVPQYRYEGTAHRYGRNVVNVASDKIHDKISTQAEDNAGAQFFHDAEYAGEKQVRKYFSNQYTRHNCKEDIRVKKRNKRSSSSNKGIVKATKTQMRQNKFSTIYETKSNFQKSFQRKKTYYSARAKSWYKNKGGSVASVAGNLLKQLIISNKSFLLSVAALFAILTFLPMALASCGTIVVGGFTSVISMVVSSFQNEPAEITEVFTYITEKDTDLFLEVHTAADADKWAHIDSFDLKVNGNMTTDIYRFLGLLTVLYEDFDLAKVHGDIDRIHSELYKVTYEEETITTEDEYTDPDTGETETETTTTYTLHITVDCTTVEEYIKTLSLKLDQQEHLEILVETKGNCYLNGTYGSPFDESWSLTSNYGWRCDPTAEKLRKELHNSIDIAMPENTPILAVAPGTVIFAGYNTVYGNHVILENIEGKERVWVRYSHCNELKVLQGDEVEEGEVVGLVGSTGKSTGPHLDISIKINNQWVNPLFVLSEPKTQTVQEQIDQKFRGVVQAQFSI